MLWYPGAGGRKPVAQILFGEKSPSGKLPVTFYKSLDELPEFTDYSMKGRTYRFMEGEAQFPFGYGLTYGKVEVIFAEAEQTEEGAVVKVIAKNSGMFDTEDVIQIYIKNQDSQYAVKNPELAAFQRVFLKIRGRKTSETFCKRRSVFCCA